jgi:hypothetical protein
MKVLAVAAVFAALMGTMAPDSLQAQRGGGGTPAPSPRAAAPLDLTGMWVSLVTDDWRWRMMTPPKGDVMYLPVNAAARKMAAAWDPAKDEAAGEQCKGYGAPGLLALPGRLRISWENDTTLKLEADSGTQTRLFHFSAAPPGRGQPTWQGQSVAGWELPGGGRGRRGAGTASGGQLKVVTNNLRPGYFRKNGVPFSSNAVLTEYYVVLREESGLDYLAITRILDDPTYLTEPYVRTVQFKKEQDGSGWKPAPCSAR